MIIANGPCMRMSLATLSHLMTMYIHTFQSIPIYMYYYIYIVAISTSAVKAIVINRYIHRSIFSITEEAYT